MQDRPTPSMDKILNPFPPFIFKYHYDFNWPLIKDNVINKLFKFKLLNLPQRLASLYILFEMYKNDKANTTPFISLIIEIAQESKNLTEKKFVMELSDISSKVEIKK